MCLVVLPTANGTQPGVYTRKAYIEDWLACNSCACVSSTHRAEHACRASVPGCYRDGFPYYAHSGGESSRVQAIATVPEHGGYSQAENEGGGGGYCALPYSSAISPSFFSASLVTMLESLLTVCIVIPVV